MVNFLRQTGTKDEFSTGAWKESGNRINQKQEISKLAATMVDSPHILICDFVKTKNVWSYFLSSSTSSESESLAL